MEGYDKNKESLFWCIGMQTTYKDGQYLRNYLRTILNGKKKHQCLTKILYKDQDQNNDKGAY